MDDFDAAAGRLREAGAEVAPIQRAEYGAHFEVVGPEGYVFQLSRPTAVS